VAEVVDEVESEVPEVVPVLVEVPPVAELPLEVAEPALLTPTTRRLSPLLVLRKPEVYTSYLIPTNLCNSEVHRYNIPPFNTPLAPLPLPVARHTHTLPCIYTIPIPTIYLHSTPWAITHTLRNTATLATTTIAHTLIHLRLRQIPRIPYPLVA
jgi:hypothetical protein